jgi:hypothetical protein
LMHSKMGDLAAGGGGGSASMSAASKVFPEGRSRYEQATQPQQGLG